MRNNFYGVRAELFKKYRNPTPLKENFKTPLSAGSDAELIIPFTLKVSSAQMVACKSMS